MCVHTHGHTVNKFLSVSLAVLAISSIFLIKFIPKYLTL